MKRNALFLLTIFLLLCSQVSVNAKQTQQFQQEQPKSQQTYGYQQSYTPDAYYSSEKNVMYDDASRVLKGRVVIIPQNTVFSTVSTAQISSEDSLAGDMVTFTLPENFMYNGAVIAPAGSVVNGTIVTLVKAGHATRNAQLKIKFTNIVTPMGQTIPISGVIKTDDGTGLISGGTKMDTTKEYAKDVGIGAASGAVLGLTMGALSGGSVGMGAVYGTVIGSGLGLGKSLIDKGGAVVIPANSRVDIVINQPMTVAPHLGY